VKIFFCGEVCESVCVLGSVLVSVVVSGCVWAWFGALSMLSKVTFYVAKGDV